MDTLFQIGLSNAVMATMLAVLAAGVGRLYHRPALVHCLWLLVLLKLMTPSFVLYPIPWLEGPRRTETAFPATAHSETGRGVDSRVGGEPDGEIQQREQREADVPAALLSPSAVARLPQAVETPHRGDEPHRSSSAAVDRSDPVRTWGAAFPLSTAGAILWLAGSITWFAVVAYRTYRFHCLLRGARPAPAKLVEQVQRLAQRLGLAACPTVWLLPGRLSPMVWALAGRPRLLVSNALWERLTAEQQTTLLIHELAHLRRRDHLVRNLELLVIGLYWWHPVVWWACRELREAEEQCCDAWVVWILPRATRAYATALVETIDFLSETPAALPAVASGIGHVHDLRRRLTMIMHGTTPRAVSGVGLGIVLGLGAFLLPLGPTWAQDEAPKARRPTPEAAEERRLGEQGVLQIEEALPRDHEDFTTKRQALAQQVERMRANLNQAMADLRRAEAQLAALHDQQRRAGQEAVRPQPEGARPQPPSARPRGREQAADPEHRLAELERKLDDLLAEVQSLRREVRRSGSQWMPGATPGMPGAIPLPTPRPGARAPSGVPLPPGAPPTPAPAAAVPATPARSAPASPATSPVPLTPPSPPDLPGLPRSEASTAVPF